MITIPILLLFVIGAGMEGVSFVGVLFFLPGVLNIGFGVPAIAEWRRLTLPRVERHGRCLDSASRPRTGSAPDPVAT